MYDAAPGSVLIHVSCLHFAHTKQSAADAQLAICLCTLPDRYMVWWCISIAACYATAFFVPLMFAFASEPTTM